MRPGLSEAEVVIIMFNVKQSEDGASRLDQQMIRDDQPPICDYEDSTYRVDFWEGQGRAYEDMVERHALTAMLPAKGRRLVDIGAGFGRLGALYDGFEQVILLDYSRSQLEYARQRWGDERFIYVAADLYHLPLATNVVDAMVMVRVLHHIADVPTVFQALERALTARGQLVLEFANKRHLKNIARYLLRRGVNPFEQSPYEFAELHFDFHPQWIKQQLAQAGFSIKEERSVSILRSALLKRIFPLSLLVSIDSRLQRAMAPLAVSPSIFFKCIGPEIGSAEPLSRELLFRCPMCEAEPLEEKGDHLLCTACQVTWPIENGVYILK